MKILLIHQHYFPEMSGTARRAKELAEGFVKRGYDVNILTSFPRDYRSMPNSSYNVIESLNGVSIYRVSTLFEIQKNVVLRMLSYLSFVVISIKLGLKLSRKSDIIISIAPLPSGILGGLLHLFNKKYHHFDIPDILPDLGIAAGMIKNKGLIYLLRKIEIWAYSRANSISTCTKGQMNNIHSKGVPDEKLSCIPDWIDTAYFKNNLNKHKLFIDQKYAFPNKVTISFVGNIGALQNPDVFVEVMKDLANDGHNKYIFLFIGDGIMLPRIKEKILKLKLNNIKIIGRVDRKYIPGLMKKSDILVTNYISDEHLNLYVPGKLFEYAISNKPIIIGSKGDAKNFIEKYNFGIVVAPSNKIAFKKAILEVTNGNYNFLPKTDKFISDYSIENILDKYENIINNSHKGW